MGEESQTQQVAPDAESSRASEAREDGLPDEGTMSFGDHLEALRSCIVRSLLGLAAGTLLSLVFAKKIMAFLLEPVLVTLDRAGQWAQIQALSPPDTFVTYLKMAILAGMIVAMPWVLMQIWEFVCVGLYERERRFVRMFTPVSVLLFAAGVAFMFYVVLPIVLNFFVKFGDQIVIEDLRPSRFQALLLAEETDPDQPQPSPRELAIPARQTDPENAPVGSVWINTRRNLLCVQTGKGPFTVPMQRLDVAPAVRSQFGLKYYVSFVLALSLAFGLAFELPLVVLFMTTTQLVTVPQLVKSRRYVIFGVFLAAAFLTPPDVISQLLLAIPMIFLFEGALVVSRVMARRRQERHTAAEV
jgi:sec-independent protein translocase protein TatC